MAAAENGDAAAQFNLAIFYDSRLDDNGYVIEGNRVEAMRWLLAAAEQGLPRAQSQLATMYADGADAPEDQIKACGWFLLAITSLHGIHRHQAQSGYDRASADLTPAQLGRASQFASDWKPQEPARPAIGSRRPLNNSLEAGNGNSDKQQSQRIQEMVGSSATEGAPWSLVRRGRSPASNDR